MFVVWEPCICKKSTLSWAQKINLSCVTKYFPGNLHGYNICLWDVRKMEILKLISSSLPLTYSIWANVLSYISPRDSMTFERLHVGFTPEGNPIKTSQHFTLGTSNKAACRDRNASKNIAKYNYLRTYVQNTARGWRFSRCRQSAPAPRGQAEVR